MLVAPVISTEKRANVYLPKGDWYRLSSGKKFKGLQVGNVAAPLTDLPVFVKASGIIPMQTVIQSTAEKGDGILQLHIWNGTEANEFVYYEDDGISYNYQQGEYYKRSISFYPTKKQIVLAIPQGAFKSRFAQVNLMLHGFGNLKTLNVNDATIKADIRSAKTASFIFSNFKEAISILY